MMNLTIIILLVLLSALFSGLTLGLLSLSKSDLERKIKIGDKLSKQAEKVYSVRKNGNFLLCTLLLGNVAVNATLTQFLGVYGSGVIAVTVSTGLITLFGEIFPQALISKHALKIGSKLVFLVRILQFLLYPLAKPISMFLDWWLGEELRSYFSKEELIEEIKNHEDSSESEIDHDEEKILVGALTYSDKEVESVMTPKPAVYMLEKNTEIKEELISEIKTKGYTRIPIYEDDSSHISNIVGILLTKKLIGISEGNISDYVTRKFKVVKQTTHLDKMLNYFTDHKQHLTVVVDEYKTVVGIVTMEDIIEEILDREIVDETDEVSDTRSEFETN